MHYLIKLLSFSALTGLAGASHGQTIYKCSTGGAVTYSDTPCVGASMKAMAVPPAPTPDPAYAAEVERRKAKLATVLEERADSAEQDARDSRANARADRRASAHHQRCDELRKERKAIDAAAFHLRGDRRAAKWEQSLRLGQRIASECPG